MKNVLLLGAGLVAKPLVRYLLDQPDFHLLIATRTVSKADALLDGHPQGESRAWTVDDTTALEPSLELVKRFKPEYLPLCGDLEGHASFLSNRRLHAIGWQPQVSWRDAAGEEGEAKR